MLIDCGANDPRCPPWHGRKLAARMQAAGSGALPVLLRVRAGAGTWRRRPRGPDPAVRRGARFLRRISWPGGLRRHRRRPVGVSNCREMMGRATMGAGRKEFGMMFDREEIAQLAAAAVSGRKRQASGRNGVVVSSHPIVSHVAVKVLNDGGNAVDAALAASLAQTVVEPHMTTAFGVLSMMHYDATTGATQYVNGSMNAPARGSAGLFGGRRRDRPKRRGPGFLVGMGSFARTLCDQVPRGARGARDRTRPHRLPDLSDPLWHDVRGGAQDRPDRSGAARSIFATMSCRGPGETLVNHALADTLERMAADGVDYFLPVGLHRKGGRDGQARGRCPSPWRISTATRRAGWSPAWGSYRDYRIAGSPSARQWRGPISSRS